MTADVSVDEPRILRQILSRAKALLLDFDGPICSVFAGLPAFIVADQLRAILAQGGQDLLPAEVEKTDDPFDVFSYAARLGGDEARYIEAALRAHEVEAVALGEPTPGAHELIREWRGKDRKLAIVSNNSAEAVHAYLELHSLTPFVDIVSARTRPDPTLLKPNTWLLDQALDHFQIPAKQSVLIGDSISDVYAASAASTPAIGYANKPGKIKLLADAGAAAIACHMTLIGQSAT